MNRECLNPPQILQKMIFPRIEETRAAVENTSISERDVATQCFLDLLTWFRVVILQDAVFLRKQFPSLNLWRQSPFNHSAFEEFSNNLFHEASFGEDPKYVQISKTMPKMAQLMQDHQQNIMSNLLTYHQSSEGHRNKIQAQLNEHTNILKPLSLFLQRLTQGGVQLRTQLALDDVDIDLTTPSSSSNPSNPVGLPSNPVGLLTASHSPDDSVVQYQLNANIATIPALWEEYDQGIMSASSMSRGPSIRELNDRFGIKWRRVDPYRKQYARRRHIWEAILRASENLAFPPEIVAEKMERWRSNHNYSLNKVNTLLSTIAPDAPGLWGENDIELRHMI